MKELVRYIARFDPEYPRTVRGASPEEIGYLSTLVGRPLPEDYQDFLATMGHDMGNFHPFNGEKDFSVETITAYYENEERLHPPSFILIAMDDGPEGLDVFLEILPPPAKPRVVQFAVYHPFDPAQVRVKFENLADMLFTLAFTTVRFGMFPHRTSLVAPHPSDWESRSPVPRLEAFKALAERLGFERVPYTGNWSPGYDRGDAVAHCYQPPPFAPYFSLAAEKERELFRLAEVMMDTLGLIPGAR
ncbi:MAG TPA: SMI1/KNR4 family protein [Gemmataceae bacterium]